MASYEYDCNILYNYARSPLSKTPDTNLSLQFVNHIVRECERHELKCYYHDRDALPGKLLFQELTEVIKSSRFTVLILTKDFVKDCYSTYRQYTALKMLIDEKRIDKLIPVAIGLEQVPDDLGSFLTEHFLAHSWDTDESNLSLGKLIRRLTGQDDEVIYRRNIEAVQERGDNQQRTDNYEAYVAEATPSLTHDGSSSEVSDSSRVMDAPPATIQEEISYQQESVSMSLVEGPSIRPPNLIKPRSTAGLSSSSSSSSNQNDAPPVAPNDSSSIQRGSSAGRQISLSRDGDLSMDHGSSQSHNCTPDSTDSGISPDNCVDTASTFTEAAGSLEDISENTIVEGSSFSQGTVGNNIMNVNNSNGADSWNESLSSQTYKKLLHQTQHHEGASSTTVNESLDKSMSSLANQEIPHHTQHLKEASISTMTESLNVSLCSQAYQETAHQRQHLDGTSITTMKESLNKPLSSQANQETAHQIPNLKEASYTTTSESDSYMNGEEDIEVTEVFEQATCTSKIEDTSPPMTEDGYTSNTCKNKQRAYESTDKSFLFKELLLWLIKPECAYKGLSS